MHVSEEHFLLVSLFRDHPALAVWLAELSQRIDLPPTYTIEAFDPLHSDARRAADIAFVLTGPAGVDLLTLTIEIQRAPDPDKDFAWPGYGWLERTRRRCDSHVLVVATRRSVATWARRFERCIPGDPVHVIVLGPDEVPRITDLAEARAHPARAILSAVLHARAPGGHPVRRAAAAALLALPAHQRRQYIRLVFRDVPHPATAALFKEVMQQQQQFEEPLDCSGLDAWIEEVSAPAVARAEAQVALRTRADILLQQLKQRGLRISAPARARILACTDTAELDRWLARVLTARRVADLFA